MLDSFLKPNKCGGTHYLSSKLIYLICFGQTETDNEVFEKLDKSWKDHIYIAKEEEQQHQDGSQTLFPTVSFMEQVQSSGRAVWDSKEIKFETHPDVVLLLPVQTVDISALTRRILLGYIYIYLVPSIYRLHWEDHRGCNLLIETCFIKDSLNLHSSVKQLQVYIRVSQHFNYLTKHFAHEICRLY